MLSAHHDNDLWLATMDTLIGKNADLEPGPGSFRGHIGDFSARFTAAVEALFATKVRPETFIEIPEHPERLSKAELDHLVRPAAHGFLRSYPSKDSCSTRST